MATSVAAVASSSLHLSCEPRQQFLSPRHGISLAPVSRTFAPLKSVSNGSRVHMSSNGKHDGSVQSAVPATALALLAAAVIPEIAEAAQPGISPSLKNLLLSVVAGGVVLVVIGGAVAAVSTFDPVKRK